MALNAKQLGHAIDQYFEWKETVQTGLGYKGDWVEIPMDDQREMYWMLCGPNDTVSERASSFPSPPGSDCGAGGAAFCTFHPGLCEACRRITLAERGASARGTPANREGVGAWCVWSKKPFTAKSLAKDGEFYSGRIYTQRFLKKWVYRAPGFVMVSVDTQTDGNRFLMIFDAAKECEDDALRAEYMREWARKL